MVRSSPDPTRPVRSPKGGGGRPEGRIVIVSYTGKAELVAPGRPPTRVMVHVEARHREVIGAEGGSEWRGQITAGADLLSLRDAKLELLLPGGRVGEVLVQDSGGNFVGIDTAPI